MTRLDALLVAMVLVWGTNFSVLKVAFQDMPPQSFNSIRILLASIVFILSIAWARRSVEFRKKRISTVFYTPNPLTARDRWDLVWLGVVGHCFYQLGFAGGVDLTSVANASLLMGATPVAVALLSLALGRERLHATHWAGVALSCLGVYFVVGGASFGGATLRGDLLVLGSVMCWSAYTIGAMRMMQRHSPLYVTGVTMAIGGLPYIAIAMPQMLHTDWGAVSLWTWGALVWSALFALNLAYLAWYISVQRLGPARTAVYSNVVPIAALAVAALWLREPITATKAIGAAAILGGVFLTRLGRKPSGVPIEE